MKTAASSPPLASAIYQGTVRHRRYTPRHHAFTYNVFMVYLDLQELDTVFKQSRWWSCDRINFACFKRSDFFDGATDTLLYDAVSQWVEQQTGRRQTGPIRMLTNLRYFGFIINPITCYYCFDDSGTQLQTVIAEVTNTPWKQRCQYVLDFASQHQQTVSEQEQQTSDKQRLQFSKAMHVSPFQPMDLEYYWKGKTPGEDLLVHIDVCQRVPQQVNRQQVDAEEEEKQQPVFDATMVLKHQPMTGPVMNRMLFRYPWMTLKVFAGIYWQALKLALKQIPYHPNPGADMTTNKAKIPLPSPKAKIRSQE